MRSPCISKLVIKSKAWTYNWSLLKVSNACAIKGHKMTDTGIHVVYRMYWTYKATPCIVENKLTYRLEMFLLVTGNIFCKVTLSWYNKYVYSCIQSSIMCPLECLHLPLINWNVLHIPLKQTGRSRMQIKQSINKPSLVGQVSIFRHAVNLC